jgi:hypothetical protein
VLECDIVAASAYSDRDPVCPSVCLSVSSKIVVLPVLS